MRLYPIQFFIHKSERARAEVITAFLSVVHEGQAYQFARERVLPLTLVKEANFDLRRQCMEIVKREVRRHAIQDLLFPELFESEPKTAAPPSE